MFVLGGAIADHVADAWRWTGIPSADATAGEATPATLSSGKSATLASPPLTLPSPQRGEGEEGG